MLRSTTTSIRSAISSLAKLTRNDEPARWPSGAPSRPSGRLGLGVLRHTQATCRYSDKAVDEMKFGVRALPADAAGVEHCVARLEEPRLRPRLRDDPSRVVADQLDPAGLGRRAARHLV